MRPALLIGVLTAMLGSAGLAFADPEPYTAIIRVPEVPVRSGPSTKGYYATSMLHKSDKVRVVKQEDGWLYISARLPELAAKHHRHRRPQPAVHLQRGQR